MKKTVITHVYNEEYLMYWWLKHHREHFDHGVIIDFGSTDGTLDLVRDLCPTWEIINMNLDYFDIFLTDYEVMKAESRHEGWKICLCVTEFLVGNFSSLDSVPQDNKYFIQIGSDAMVDVEPHILPTKDKPLIEQKTFGISYNDDPLIRGCRLLHNAKCYHYNVGRHFKDSNADDFKILWYNLSPFNEEFIKRKLQIQNTIPEFIKEMGMATHHFYNREELFEKYNTYLPRARNLFYEYSNFKI